MVLCFIDYTLETPRKLKMNADNISISAQFCPNISFFHLFRPIFRKRHISEFYKKNVYPWRPRAGTAQVLPSVLWRASIQAGGETSLKSLPIKESPGSGISPGFVEQQILRELSELQESSRKVKTKHTQLPIARRQLCVCLFSNPSWSPK